MPHDMFYLAHRMLPFFFFFKATLAANTSKARLPRRTQASQLEDLAMQKHHFASITTTDSWCSLSWDTCSPVPQSPRLPITLPLLFPGSYHTCLAFL